MTTARWTKIKGFTLIELLIVIAILGLLAAGVLVAINPAKRTASARDAQRKTDVGQIAQSLVEYYVFHGQYPDDVNCDSSIGSGFSCPASGSNWSSTSDIYEALIGEQILTALPTDPFNNSTYHYRYEPRDSGEAPCNGTGRVCKYWVGTRLEAPDDPAKPYYRCSDVASGFAPIGCLTIADWYQ